MLSERDPAISFTADGAYTFDGGTVKIVRNRWVSRGQDGLVLLRLSAPACNGARRRRRHNAHNGAPTQELVEQICSDGPSLCKHHAEG